MRLKRLDLTAYGKFTGAHLDFGDAPAAGPDLHVVYGLNEAGKSTAFSAYLDLLFGIPLKSPYAFKHPYDTMEIGATLEIDGAAHALVRRKLKANSLLDARGQPVNEALIAAALGGIGRDAYRTMFSLDDQSLKEGGQAIEQSKGDLGELLFSASAGLADVSRTLALTREEAGQIHKRKGRATKLAQARQQLAALKERRAEIDIQASTYAGLVTTEKQAARAYDEAMRQVAALRARQATINRLLRALPLQHTAHQVEQALLAFADLPRVSHDLAGLLPQLIRDEARLEAQATSLAANEARIEAALADIVVDDLLLSLESRFQDLADLRARNRTAETDLPRRRAALDAKKAELALALAALGQAPETAPASLVIPADRVGRLRDLIEQRSGIDTALNTTLRELQRIEAEATRLGAEQQPLPAGGENAPLWRRLELSFNTLSRSDLLVRRSVEQRALAVSLRALEEAQVALSPFTGDLSALRTITLPDRRRIDEWRQEAGRIARRIAQHQDRIRDIEAELHPLRTVLDQGQSAAQDYADAAADGARRRRDDLWRAHVQALSSDSAARFEAAMRDNDQIMDQRLTRAAELAALRQTVDRLALSEAALGRENALLQKACGEREALASRIAALTPSALGALADDPEDRLMQLGSFHERRQAALAHADEVEAIRNRLDALDGEQQLQRQALTDALEQAGIAFSPRATLTELLDRAEEALHAHRLQAEKAELLALNRAELDGKLAERRRERQAAEQALARWQDGWRDAVTRTWLSPEAMPSEIRAQLDALTQLPALIRELDDLGRRVEAMEEDQRAFAEAVSTLCTETGRSHLPARVDDNDAALHAAFLEAKQRAEHRQALLAERERLERDGLNLNAESLRHAAERDRLTRLFACDGLEELGRKIDAAAERDRLEERLLTLRQQLLAELRVASPDEAKAMLSDIDADLMATEAQGLADEIEREDGRCRELFAERAKARDRLEAVGGDGLVAALEAQKATLLIEIEDMALHYLRLQTGVLAAESALELYREKHRSAMMQRASEAFRQMTRGDYSGLAARADKEREVLIGIARDGASKPSDTMSTGTRTQLYLALRLAGYEEFAKVSPPVPFIADDIMETFDEPRSEEVFRLFGSMASLGQVIYFTHHRHLCDIASAVVPGVRIHALSGGEA